MIKADAETPIVVDPARLSTEQLARYRTLYALLQRWRAEDTADQEESWIRARDLLAENGLSDRKRGHG